VEDHEVGHPPVNGADLALDEVKHLTTGCLTGLLYRKQSADLVEGQAECFGPPDKAESLDIPLAIAAIARRASVRLREQSNLLIRADRLRVEAEACRQLTDLHFVTHDFLLSPLIFCSSFP